MADNDWIVQKKPVPVCSGEDDEVAAEEFLLLAFDSFLKNTPDLMFVKDKNLRYLAASKAFAAMVGYESGDELAGKSDYDLFDQELAARYTLDDRKLLENGVPIIDYVEPLPDLQGRKSYSSTSKYLIYNGAGNIIGLYGMGRDVTERIELEEEREYRQQSSKMFEDVLEADVSEDRMLTTEGSEWVTSLREKTDGSFSGVAKVLASLYIHPNYVDEFMQLYDINRLRQGYELGEREFTHLTYQTVNGKEYRWIEYRSRLYLSRVSHTLRITSFLKDKNDEIQNHNRLILKAETDMLTGLLNRSSVVAQINSILAGDGRQKVHALLFIDLDHFKQVNDRFGHPFGDKVLRRAAGRLTTLFQGREVLGRVGGDEFLVFMRDVLSVDAVRHRAEQIVEMVSFQPEEEDEELWVTCSIGIALYEADGKTLEQLYEEADKAMYVAKETGRNRIAFYEKTDSKDW